MNLIRYKNTNKIELKTTSSCNVNSEHNMRNTALDNY